MPSGVTKVVLNKVKADLEANPKESFTEEEMEQVRWFLSSVSCVKIIWQLYYVYCHDTVM